MRIQVGNVADINEGKAVRVTEGAPEPIAVFRFPTGFYAVSDTCTHAESSLVEGEVDVDENEIECEMHGAVFDVTTGEAKSLPATEPVKTYPTFVEDDVVYIEV